MLYLQTLFVQYRPIYTGSSCALIPDHSNTLISTQGTHNPACMLCLLDLNCSIQNGQIERNNSSHDISNPARLAFNSHYHSVTHRSWAIFQLQISSEDCFNSIPTTSFLFTVFCTKIIHYHIALDITLELFTSSCPLLQ